MAELQESESKQESKAVGTEWGFTDPEEAVAHPMTLEERDRWFGIWQCTPAVQWLMDFGDEEGRVWRDFDRHTRAMQWQQGEGE